MSQESDAVEMQKAMEQLERAADELIEEGKAPERITEYLRSKHQAIERQGD
jgi:hypothetical protein